MNFTGKNIKEFIEYIITQESVFTILDNCKDDKERGFIFERLYDIVIKFGFCDKFSNAQYNHIIGNVNNGEIQKLKNFTKYLQSKIKSSKSSGTSDITLQDKKTGEYTFISSKYPKTVQELKDKKQKDVFYYDVQNIISMIDHNKDLYQKFTIKILVPNKDNVLYKVNLANKASVYITKYLIEENILDVNDLNKYFLKFKEDIIKNIDKNLSDIYLSSQENFQNRFHQELLSNKCINLIVNEKEEEILIGAKQRSGKTYIVGSVNIKLLDILKKLNTLIITPAPSETAPQFTNDLFHKYKEFNNFTIHHIENSKQFNNIKLGDNNIFVISKQLLQDFVNDKTIKIISDLNLDLLIFDENHFSGTTELSKSIINSYSSKNTKKIYLTATYNKPLQQWNIKPRCRIFWDLEDEKICKNILCDNSKICDLYIKHNEKDVNDVINYYKKLGLSINDIFAPYKIMPDLYILSNMFDSERYNILKEKLNNNNNKFGFCFETLFTLNKDKTKLIYEDEVKEFLRYISSSNKEEDGNKTFYSRINKICKQHNQENPFTQIWFLPPDNINEISTCLETLMKEDDILKKYEILCINRKNKKLAKDVKLEINKSETIAKNKGKRGVILLAGTMLSLGITLSKCDLVILMNDTISSDKVSQQIYRCGTERNNKKIRFYY
jgi:hypothetical protein